MRTWVASKQKGVGASCEECKPRAPQHYRTNFTTNSDTWRKEQHIHFFRGTNHHCSKMLVALEKCGFICLLFIQRCKLTRLEVQRFDIAKFC